VKKHSLGSYVSAVIIIIILVNTVIWRSGKIAELQNVAIFSAGFLVGMLAMYIAVHIYRWK